ncbi:ATP-dependent DNA helicase [Clostridium hydrogenum]|uniref:ATP-dependent DNA helicase n=1 Tax=Clostridium hydrogenum TaxID=2855764 RepID=UPI001F444D85|nr:ATP-dependent DNA helicase [Clostridium hydrogenum]
MSEYSKIKISVRNLVEFVMRKGDLDNRFQGISRAVDGTKIHGKLQRENKKLYSKKENCSYNSEVFMKYEVSYKEIDFLVDGRADEIISDEGKIIINEIKSTARSLEFIDENYNELHWLQAKCYGYIYGLQNNVDSITIRLTYVNADTYECKVFEKVFNNLELKAEFFKLLELYIVWAKFTEEWIKVRETSIKKMQFPFQNYRKGQRELAVYVYKAIQENKNAFIKAPTGIGKTISTIFPAVKAMGEELNEKIFYLTAKGTNGNAAEDAINLMRKNNLKLKSIVITSKEKICFNDEISCNPEGCIYAKGHYDRVNEAILDILKNEDNLSRDKIEKYASKHKVCPFEFSLDLTLWSDLIICDYNYVFDPAVYLRRFFSDNNGKYTFLIDEAHNLVDRARNMYSASLCKSTVMKLKKAVQNKKGKLYKVLNELNKVFIELKKVEAERDVFVQEEIPKDVIRYVLKFTTICEEWLIMNADSDIYKDMLDFYFECTAFARIAELYDDAFVFLGEKTHEDFIIKLYCLDPSKLIKEASKRGKTSVFFSATLTPMNYYKEMYGATKEDYSGALKSPFSEKNCLVAIENRISTKYINREKSYDDIVEYINSFISPKKGNYMVFFPSYKYMEEVYERFSNKYNYNVVIQSGSMDEVERKDFLDKFKNNSDEEIIAFCVMGGVFSEGIDLKGESLIGAVIVGVGLPKVCIERELIRKYFSKKNNLGYEYAYIYPGMNKVLQAAGRVIRSEEDIGAILLLDERFGNGTYRSLFPIEWSSRIFVKNKNEIEEKIKNFWNYN